MADENFYELRMKASLNREAAAKLFNVTLRTVNNWDKEKCKVPKAVILFLQLKIGDLSFLGKKWRGFYLSDECLEAPNGDFIYYYECHSIKYLYEAADRERFKMARMLKQRFDSETEAKIFDVKLYAVK